MTTISAPTEQQEAEALAQYLRLKGYRFTHIPNETGGDAYARRRAVRMKRAGVSRGFPDYLAFKDGRRYAIELKRQKGGRATPEQLEWLDVLDGCGFFVKLARGAGEAVEWLESFRS